MSPILFLPRYLCLPWLLPFEELNMELPEDVSIVCGIAVVLLEPGVAGVPRETSVGKILMPFGVHRLIVSRDNL